MHQTILTATKQTAYRNEKRMFKVIKCLDCGSLIIRRRTNATNRMRYCAACRSNRKAAKLASYIHFLNTEE